MPHFDNFSQTENLKKLTLHLLRPLQLPHRSASLVQDQLVHADEDAVLGPTAKVLDALHGAVVLARGRVQLDADPGAALKKEQSFTRMLTMSITIIITLWSSQKKSSHFETR